MMILENLKMNELNFIISEKLLLFFLIGYLFGSIPFGIIFTKFGGVEDIRKIGSGNIGATNVLRTGKKKLAFFTLFFDIFKSYIAIKLSLFLISEYDLFNIFYQNELFIISFVGVFSVLGHCFPIWLNFTGGKGVATGIGVMLAFNPILSFLGILIWIIIFFITKTSSISALVMYFCYPLLLYTVNADKNLTIGFLIISFTIFCKHYENILRLIKKEELKFKK
jgi:glycerol-3-phosphate acyltransferase PlsY